MHALGKREATTKTGCEAILWTSTSIEHKKRTPNKLTLSAGGALTARLVSVEVRQTANGGNHVHRLVHYGHSGRAQRRARRLQVVEVHHHLC